MNHTPGPWTFDASIINDTYLGQILAPSRAIVSLFRHHDRNNKKGQLQEDLANAYLIAAAPAMKEALGDLVKEIKHLGLAKNVKKDFSIMLYMAQAEKALTLANGGKPNA